MLNLYSIWGLFSKFPSKPNVADLTLGIIFDKQSIDLVKNQGWSVSCTYDFESDFKKGTYHGLDYDMEFTGGEFLHLALVPNPRYERATIVMNSQDPDKELLFLEGLRDILANHKHYSESDKALVKEIERVFNSFPDHEGRPGKIGGSLPREGNNLTVEEKTKNIKPIKINKSNIPNFENPKALQQWVKTEFEKLGSVKIEDTGIEVRLSASKANRETNKRRSLKEENKAVFSQFEEIVKTSIKKEDRQQDERHTKGQEVYYNRFQIIDGENIENYEVNIYVDKPASGDKNSYYAGHSATKIEIAPSDSQVANNSFNLHAKVLIEL